MPSTPALFDTMARQVEEACERRRSETKAEADRIREEGIRTADHAYDLGLQSAQAEIDEADRRVRRQVEAEAEKATLAAQHQVVEEVLDEVRREIERVAGEAGFAGVLETLLEEVLERTPGEGLIVLAPPAHADGLREWLARTGRSGLEVRPWPALRDGVAVQDVGRTFRVSNTLGGRLTVIQNDARRYCRERLFGAEG